MIEIEDDEAFNEVERQAQQRKAAVKYNIADTTLQKQDRHYQIGWNSALELAAYEIEHKFKQAFGADTLSSIAIYIRGMKK